MNLVVEERVEDAAQRRLIHAASVVPHFQAGVDAAGQARRGAKRCQQVVLVHVLNGGGHDHGAGVIVAESLRRH